MKRIFILLALVATSFSLSAKEYPYQSVNGDPMQARIYTLDNGLTVYLTQNKAKPEILAQIVVRAGAQNDPLESTGLAHYQEHLMFKGTESYGTTDYEAELPNLLAIDSLYELYGHTTDPAQRKAIYHLIDSFSYEGSKIAIANEFDKLMSGIGATDVNAYTSPSMTCYHEVIPNTELARWAIVESDRFQNLVIRGFHTELEAVYEEFNMYSTMDVEKAMLAVDQTLYPNVPYRQHTVLGTQEHLKNPSIKNIRAFYNTYYRPNNVAVCLSGDFEFDEAIDVISHYFGKWEARPVPAAVRYDQPALPAHRDTVVYGNEAPQLWMAWKLPAINHEDATALEVLFSVLQNGKCGLFDLDITQKQALLDASAFVMPESDYTTCYLIGSPKQKQTLEDVRTIFLAEIDKLKKGDFSDQLMGAIVRNSKRDELTELQYNYARIDRFIRSFVYGVPYETIVKEPERRERVTKDDIVRVANKYFTDSYACVFKQNGPDANPPKIEKPAITPIEMNREAASLFYQSFMAIESERPRPQFLDFERDLSRSVLPNGVELLYCRNTENELSDLTFISHVGTDQIPELEYATAMLDYLGTESLTPEAYRRALYAQAAEVNIGAAENDTYLYLHGLAESLPTALALMEDHVLTAQPDKKILRELIKDNIKQHNDAKSDQQSCFSRLMEYSLYGPDALRQRTLMPKQLKKIKAQDLKLTDFNLPLTRIEYYGPLSEEEVKQLLASSKLLEQAIVENPELMNDNRVKRTRVETPEVLIAPYNANNTFIMAYANSGETYNPRELALLTLFNEYFGGSMGGVVFQEMRESRALCYSAWAAYRTPEYKGDDNYVFKGVITQNDKLADCITTLNAICDSMPLSQTAFDNAMNAVILQIGQRRFVRSQPIQAYVQYTQRGWDHDLWREAYNEVQKLTLADLEAFAKQRMANRTYRYAILGNPKELNLDYLSTVAPVRKLSLKDIFVY